MRQTIMELVRKGTYFYNKITQGTDILNWEYLGSGFAVFLLWWMSTEQSFTAAQGNDVIGLCSILLPLEGLTVSRTE